MGAFDITLYITWTTKILIAMCLFSLGMIKAYDMDFVVRVLAGFELASLN